MAAFLFIPVDGSGAGAARRVDFGNIGSLFTEVEEPPRPERGRRTLRIAAAVLLALVACGDMLLVARPGVLCAAGAPPHGVAPLTRTVTL